MPLPRAACTMHACHVKVCGACPVQRLVCPGVPERWCFCAALCRDNVQGTHVVYCSCCFSSGLVVCLVKQVRCTAASMYGVCVDLKMATH